MKVKKSALSLTEVSSGSSSKTVLVCPRILLPGLRFLTPAFTALSGKMINGSSIPVSYTHLRAHETLRYLVCRLLQSVLGTRTSSIRHHNAGFDRLQVSTSDFRKRLSFIPDLTRNEGKFLVFIGINNGDSLLIQSNVLTFLRNR